MFGSPWTGIITAAVLKTTIDLCDETSEPTEDSIFFAWSNELNDQYDIAVFYDDPYAAEGGGACDYSQMAQTAERLYPSAKYLLVSKDTLSAMRKGDEEPDTNLSLASIQLEDAEAINNMFRNETGEIISDGVILVTIDAYSRAYVDTCNCDDDEAGVKQKRARSTMFRVSSMLSIVGSIYVIFSLIWTSARRKKNLQMLFNRLLISICFFDITSSIAFFCGLWAAPSSPPGDFGKYYSQAQWDVDNPDAYGNSQTCSVEGVLLQVGVCGSALFTAFLTLQTLLVVKHGWTDKKMRKVEIFFFSFGIGLPLLTAVAAGAMGLMSIAPAGFCWIALSPTPCDSKTLGPLFEGYCEENLNMTTKSRPLYLAGLAMGWALLTLLLIFYAMISLFHFVRNQENRASRWTLTAQTGRQQKLVLARSIMYISVYVLVWVPGIAAMATGGSSVAAQTTVALLVPLQGFFNAVIYTGIIEKYCIPRRTETGIPASTAAQFTNTGDMGTTSFRPSRASHSRDSNSQVSAQSGDLGSISQEQSLAGRVSNGLGE